MKLKIKAWAVMEKGEFQHAKKNRADARYMVSVQKKYGNHQKIVPCEIILTQTNNPKA